MKIRRRALETIYNDAKRCYPRECCGILLAQKEDISIISDVLRAKNAEKEHPRSKFILGYKAHLTAVELECLSDMLIVGYYHSHPNGCAQPSVLDVKQAFNDVKYLIIGINDGKIERGLWHLEGNKFIEEPLKVSQ